jgi:tetrapyrrole methylase family protein/MazG family protein
VSDARENPAPGIARLLAVVRRLRSTDGCPWDREQTLASLKRHLIEESYEVLDAVDSGDPARHREELGDVLLQLVLQAQIRSEEGHFTFDEVAEALAEKLIRRHPHVFGDVRVADSEAVLRNWEQLKAAEREDGEASLFDGVPRHLPALQKAERVQSRAARVGFDWERVDGVLAKLEEEIAELKAALADSDDARTAEELGDLLFSIVNLCRFCRVHAEEVLDGTTAKFMERFRDVERQLREQGRRLSECSPAELEACWETAKKRRSAP